MNEKRLKVFISYAHQDASEFALRLTRELREQCFIPWLDVERGIPVGARFDVSIENGIRESDVLLAVLSEHSLTAESFCRNEILFAQSKHIPVIPLRIADVDPPIQIFNVQYLDAFANPRSAREALPEALRTAVAMGSPAQYPAQAAGIPSEWWAASSDLDFSEELARHGGSFVGREWLFRHIREILARPETRLLFLSGDAGVGKSAIAAQLTTQLNVRAVHFCTKTIPESCRPSAWVRGVVSQIARQFPEYRTVIQNHPPAIWDQPASLFRTLVADPLRACRPKLDIRENWVFVIDGLDEAIAENGTGLPRLLCDAADRVPDWMRLIVTSRPDRSLLAQFRIDGVQSYHLDAEGESNRRDLIEYVSARMASVSSKSAASGDATALITRIADAAMGNFLFARMTLDALSDTDEGMRLSPEEIGSLPPRLGGLYFRMFINRFGDQSVYEKVRPILECLVAAKGPVPESLLLGAAALDETHLRAGLQALSQFISRTSRGLSLFHKSVVDWLSDPDASAEFAVSTTAGIGRLLDSCWSSYRSSPERLDWYTTTNLPAHLINAKGWDDLETVLTDIAFLDAKVGYGMVFELVDDFKFAVSAMSANRPLRRILSLIGEALGRDAQFIRRHPETLFQCLWNACWWYDCPEAEILLRRAAR